MKHKILLIDDEAAILRLLERIFYRDYEVVCASSGEQAFEQLKANPDVAVIVSDQRMPGISGTDFLEIAADICPQSQRIILTGYTNAKVLDEALANGLIHNHVTKPWNNENVKKIVEEAVQNYEFANNISTVSKQVKASV